jgi:hypothetical protein
VMDEWYLVVSSMMSLAKRSAEDSLEEISYLELWAKYVHPNQSTVQTQLATRMSGHCEAVWCAEIISISFTCCILA